MGEKVDIDGDGKADGVFLSEETLRDVLEWESEDRALYEDLVTIIESDRPQEDPVTQTGP